MTYSFLIKAFQSWYDLSFKKFKSQNTYLDSSHSSQEINERSLDI